MLNRIKLSIEKSIKTKTDILNNQEFLERVNSIADVCIEALRKHNKIMVCGNGGSASDAQHMVGELVGKFKMERKSLPAISLNSNIVIMTAIANDYSYDKIFSRQVESIGEKGDILFGLSTSGNSDNIVRAVETASDAGIITVGMTGNDGGKLKDKCTYLLNVPTNDTPRIQEAHIMLIHVICDLIESRMFKE